MGYHWENNAPRKGRGSVLEIPLDRSVDISLYRQIALHLRRMVESGALPHGERLPGSRELAGDLGVSRTTVTLAYDLLEDDGFIEQMDRRGSYVVWKKSRIRPPALEEDVTWDMASGSPSADLVPWERLASLSREVFLARGPELLQGVPSAGLPALRRSLVRHSATRGIPARWEDVVVTAGVQQGLFVALRSLGRMGAKKVWIEELTYPDVKTMASLAGLELGAIPMDPEEMIGRVSSMGRTDVLYLVPSFQNPTGRTIPLDARRALLSEASRRGVWIIEDDAYGEFRYGDESVPALRAMEEADRVIYLGSFSQLLFPGLRHGYVLCPENVMPVFLETLEIAAGMVSALVQHVVLAFIEEGGLSWSLSAARGAVASRMSALCRALSELPFPFFFNQPCGGIYLWLETPGLGGDRAASLALGGDVAVTPGSIFAFDSRDMEAVRLSVSRLDSAEIPHAVNGLKRAWERDFGSA